MSEADVILSKMTERQKDLLRRSEVNRADRCVRLGELIAVSGVSLTDGLGKVLPLGMDVRAALRSEAPVARGAA